MLKPRYQGYLLSRNNAFAKAASGSPGHREQIFRITQAQAGSEQPVQDIGTLSVLYNSWTELWNRSAWTCYLIIVLSSKHCSKISGHAFFFLAFHWETRRRIIRYATALCAFDISVWKADMSHWNLLLIEETVIIQKRLPTKITFGLCSQMWQNH